MAGKFESTEKKKRKKWPWILAICMLLIAAAALYYFYFYQGNSGTPTLIVETPQKLSASQTEDFTLDVTVSALGEARYPAMSMSIAFDSSRLEFLGVEEGNIFILSDISYKITAIHFIFFSYIYRNYVIFVSINIFNSFSMSESRFRNSLFEWI